MVAQGSGRSIEDDDDASDDVIRIGDEAEPEERNVLFTLGGAEYTVLTNPPVSLMLSYFDRIRKLGGNLAISWVLEQLISDDGYQALLESPKVSRSDYRQVVDAVVKIVIGAQEALQLPKSRKSTSRQRSG